MRYVLPALLMLACSDPAVGPDVGSRDAGPGMDAGVEVGADAAADAPTDAAADAGDPHPGWTTISDERLGRLQSAVEEARSLSGVAGLAMAAAYADTRELMVVTDGSSNTADGEVWAPERSFRIGSVTKTFTAAIILQLAGEGVIGLDDPLQTWVPGYFDDYQGTAVTLRHLITNTSGIVNYNWVGNFDMTRPWTPVEILEWGTMQEPSFEFAPGSAWQYSNTNYVLLGLVIEAATGTSYESALSSRLLEPLGLRDTYLATAISPNEHIVRSYDDDDTDISERDHPTYGWAAGGMVSTPCDLARWGTALFTGDVLSAEMRALMTTPTEHGRSHDYGTGAFTESDGGESLYGHEGGFAGFGTYLYHWATAGITLVVMRNQVQSEPALDDLANIAWVPLLGL